MKNNKIKSKTSKSNKNDFLKSNVETGAHNWNWNPDYNNYRMNDEEISKYKTSNWQMQKRLEVEY